MQDTKNKSVMKMEQTEKNEGISDIFHPAHTDYRLSPYTGLTRESWLEAGRYMLEGIFRHVPSAEDPVIVQRRETKVTYPHLQAPEEQQKREKKAELFEGLTRSFFIASVMIANEPDLVIHGIPLTKYYKEQILRTVTPGDVLYAGSYDQMQLITQEQTGQPSDPFSTYQQTVETCALVIGLMESRSQIWDTYTKKEKDTIAAFISDWANHSTVPQNWRLFNMLDLAFLSINGYPIDEKVMIEHAAAVLEYSAGDGWYRDGQCFDYYSCWAFSFYAPLWCVWYGYDHLPDIARRFERYSNELMKTYPDMFDADGWTNMWGRSCIYRNAATSAFDGNLFLRHSAIDPGQARRIASGSLLQFLQHPDFRWNGIPALGFYGQFTPLIQGYSCAESVFWLGKAFLCLHFPKYHPFWTSKERNGFFATSPIYADGTSDQTFRADEIRETVLDGPALCISNHRINGEVNLRTGKVVKTEQDLSGMWNYAKLCYNTKYPWESTPLENGKLHREMETQQYVLQDPRKGYLRANAVFWCGEQEHVLYRRQFFNWNLEQEDHWISAINLADFAVPSGIMRVDQTRLIYRPASLTLGSFGFPDNGTEIRHFSRQYESGTAEGKTEKRTAVAIVLKGHDRRGMEKQMAMTIYDGWDELRPIYSAGTNPDSEHSIILRAAMAYHHQYDASEPHVLVSQVITKESLDDFTENELFPVRKIMYEDPYACGSYGQVTVCLANGQNRRICYDGIERRMML